MDTASPQTIQDLIHEARLSNKSNPKALAFVSCITLTTPIHAKCHLLVLSDRFTSVSTEIGEKMLSSVCSLAPFSETLADLHYY